MDYKELRSIDVSKYTEKKNGLTYLSWAWAVDQLLLADPKAHWFYPEFQRWGNGTVMVFCTVVANDIARTAQLPVMDYRNKPIAEPDSFAVNTAMQRALAKAIALHGIGLYIYNGEDLPPDLGEDVKTNTATQQEPEVVSPPKKTEAVEQKPASTAKPLVDSAKVGKAPLPGSWTLKPLNDQGTAEQWMEEFEAGCDALLDLTAKEEDVLNIFTVNRPLFDRAKELDKAFYDKLMAKFTAKRKFFKEEK